MIKMKEGDKVKLFPASRFNDGETENPIDTLGTIVEIDSISELPIRVAWDNGFANDYSVFDLLLEQPEQPAFDRTAIATQILSGMLPKREVLNISAQKRLLVATALELTDELIKQLSE